MPAGKLLLALFISLGFFAGRANCQPHKPPESKPILSPPQSAPVSCGQTFYLTGTGHLDSPNTEVNSSPPNTSFFTIKTPQCNATNESSDWVLHLQGGVISLTPIPDNVTARLKAVLTSGKALLVLLLCLFVLAAVGYAVFQFVLVPHIREMVGAEVRSRVAAAVASSGSQSAAPVKERSPSRQTDNPRIAEVAQQINSFRDGEFRQLAARVQHLERHEPPIAPAVRLTKVTKSEVEATPPIIVTKEPTEPEQFITSYNKALADLTYRDQFAQRYKPKALALTNSVEVTRSKERPSFTLSDGGDLLVVAMENVGRATAALWPGPRSYLVPLYDKRWTNDRITQGSWNHFFDVQSVSGANELKLPAVVKQDGASWELDDEGQRGELAWDPNASLT